eukprot:7383554-Prymnesium_polylepis.2
MCALCGRASHPCSQKLCVRPFKQELALTPLLQQCTRPHAHWLCNLTRKHDPIPPLKPSSRAAVAVGVAAVLGDPRGKHGLGGDTTGE